MKTTIVYKYLSAGVLAATTLLPLSAQAVTSMIPAPPAINAKGYVLMDYNSGKIIASENADEPMAPASLTKIMTVYVAGQEMNSGRLSFDDTVTVSRNAWAKNFPDSSKMFIEVGDKISVANISRGIMIQSGNDASVALAEHIAGTQGAFVDLMNNWASRLGMTSSQFINAHGLDGDGIATTPRDMAILAQAMIRDTPEIYDIYKEKSFTWNGITQSNRNSLLWDKSLNVDGMKTGYTSDAGYSLVTSATDDGMRLITVVMGTPSKKARLEESRKLLTYGFRFYETDKVFSIEDYLQRRLWMGEQDELEISTSKDVYVTLPRGQVDKLTTEFDIQEPLKAPITKGDDIGTVRWLLNDEVVAEQTLIATQSVEQAGLFKRLVDTVKLFFNNLLKNFI